VLFDECDRRAIRIANDPAVCARQPVFRTGDTEELVFHSVLPQFGGERVRDGADSPQIAGTQLISGSKDSFTLFELTSTDAAGKELEWERRGCTDLRSSCHLVTTRYKANAAYIDLEP